MLFKVNEQAAMTEIKEGTYSGRQSKVHLKREHPSELRPNTAGEQSHMCSGRVGKQEYNTRGETTGVKIVRPPWAQQVRGTKIRAG